MVLLKLFLLFLSIILLGSKVKSDKGVPLEMALIIIAIKALAFVLFCYEVYSITKDYIIPLFK